MGGWSGGVYTRFRNWVTDKAASINPQATLFDQEDDGFAAGLNNCVTKDGLNKPSAAMDWNGQNLTGVLNFANTGTVSLVSGKLTMNLAGNITVTAPSSGASALVLTGTAAIDALQLNSAGQFTNLSWLNSGVLKAQGYYDNSTTTLNIGGVVAGVKLNFITGTATSRMTLAETNADALKTVDDGGTMQTVGWRDLPFNSVAGNYTLILADRGKQISQNNSGATVTIPANSSVAFPIGTTIVIFNNSVGNISIAITTDTMVIAGTVTTGTRTLASNGVATIMKSGSATFWTISGSGLT